MDFTSTMDLGKDFNPLDAIHGFQVLREQGNQAFKENNLEMAKFFYCTAMGAIQENLRHQAMSDTFDQILEEACKCTCNLSLVYLKEKNYKEALHSAEKCCQMQPNYAKAYFRRGEVHRALIEQPLALSSTMTPHDYRVKALTDYCQSYQLTNDASTLSYCVMLSVDLGSTKHMPVVNVSTDFTLVLKRILKETDFKLRYLEFLLVKPDTSRKCAKRLLPGSGMATGKCETSWLQLADLIKKFTLSRELLMALAQHGTLVTEEAVELAMSLSSDPQMPLMLCSIMESLKPPKKVDNHQLLLSALQHKRNNLVEYFMGKYPKLNSEDVWKLIYWKSPSYTHHFLKTLFHDRANLSMKNSSDQVPIEYFLFQGIWDVCDFLLDTYSPDTSMVDLTRWIVRHKAMITEDLLVKVIKCGANVDGINKSIPEPMVSAITHQRSDLGAILLNHGADLSAVRLSASSGTTLMHLAVTLALSTGIASALDRALSCHTYTIENPVVDCNGQTPLHYVILDNGKNATMVLKKLSKYPLDVDIRDKKTEKTVLELCQTKGRKHLMPLLLEAVQTWSEFKEAVQLGLDKPEAVRESCSQLRQKGNQAYRCRDLYTAKNFYLQALQQLKKLLQITRVNPDWVNAEYARISANLSLLELTQGHLPEALAAAMESIRMNHTWAKGYFRRAEVLRAMGSNSSGFYRPNPKRNCYREDALRDYLTSYSYESDVVTFCKCFTLAVDLSATDQIPDRSEFTPIVEKLLTLSVAELPHWEFLFIKPSKKKALPKCGMAKGKCKTVCIRLTDFMDKYQPNLSLIKVLIEHGTKPCLGCVIVSIDQRKPDVAVYVCNELKRSEPKLSIDYRELLKLALHKRCLGVFMHHCVKHGARFAGDDIWIVLNWKATEITEEILKLLLTYGGSADVKNDEDQLPLNFLLDRGIFSASVTLLQFPVDAGTVDVSSVIKKHGKNEIFTVELLSLILDKGGNVMGINTKLPSPIVCTLEKNRYDLAALLVDYGAQLTKIGVEKSATTSVHAATKISLHTGRADILKQVLDTYKLPDNGKLIDNNGQLPHHIAVADNTEHSKTILELLSNYPFDVEAKDRNAKTALDCCGKGRRYLRPAIELASIKWKEHCAALKGSKGKKKQKKSQAQQGDGSDSKGQENNSTTANTNTNQSTKKPEKKILLVQENLMALAGKGNYTLLKNYAKSMVDEIVHRPDVYLHLFQKAKSAGELRGESVGYTKETHDRAATATPENILTTYSKDELESDDEDFDDKEDLNAEKFEDYTWEVECTESVWKTLAKLDRPLRKLAVSKIRRLAKGEWHHKFHIPLHNLSNLHLYELRLTKRSRIIWELAIAYSPRCTQKNQTLHVDSPGTVVYSEIIRIWSVALNCSSIESVVKQIEKSHVRGQASTVVKKLQQQKQHLLKHEEVLIMSRERVPRLFRVTDLEGSATCVSVTNSDYFYPPASTKDNEYSVVTFYSFSDGFIQNLLNSEDVRRDFPFKGWPKEHDIINLDQNESILLLGRSGTGKTTCCLYRLWNQFRCYWETASDPCIPRISLIKSQLPHGYNEQQSGEVTNYCGVVSEDVNGGNTVGDNVTLCRVSGSFSKSSASSDPDSVSLSQDTMSECDDDGPHGRLTFDDDVDLWYEEESDNNDEDQCSPNIPDFSSCDTAAANPKITYVYDHLQQVFITKNSVLCAQFKRKFYDLAHTEPHLAKQLSYEDIRYPATLQEITSYSYPLFLTSRDWLILLDASLQDGDSFFPRNPDGSLAVEILDMDYNYDDYTETLVMLDESGSEEEDETAEYPKQYSRLASKEKSSWRKVDANFFIDCMWPAISKEDRKSKKADKLRVNPILIWMEIKSFIKGSSQALQTTKGYMSLEEYCRLGQKMAPNFANRRKIAYQLFERYEQMKKRYGYFDECDLVFNLFHRLSKLDDINWCIHQFYIDEVQDFTQAELTLLLHCCRWPNGLFLTGDTAQSIMRGVSFRFSDLRSVFHYISKHLDHSRGQKTKVKVPHLHDLTQNFRSHSGILQLAASVIDLLMNFFRSSLDKLPSDQGMFPGPKPVLLLSCSYSDLALLLRGNRREASAIEFGARQAIIVQSEDAKKNLPDELKAGIVLTVFESKGLEFDDVLLYNFFADSKIDKEWRVVTTYTKQYLAEHPDLDNQSHDGIEEPRPLEFDERQHKMLNSELKFLYTALTRAKCNLWIYDSNRIKRAPMFHYFQKRDLVKVVSVPSSGTDGEDSSAVESMIAAVSSSEDWKKQGDYFKKRCLWDLAILCYNKAGMPELTREVKAYSCVLMGKKYKHELKKMKEYFVTATLNFFECLKLQPSAKWIENAAVCLFNAREYDLAAPLFERLGQEDYAMKAYQKCGNLTEVANIQKKLGNVEGAIQTLMMDSKGTLFPAALKLAVEYSKDNMCAPLKKECSVNEVAHLTASYYLKISRKELAVECVELFTEVKDKINFLKRAGFIDEAVNMLQKAKQYDNLYRLLKGQEMYTTGANISSKLHDYENYCVFLLLAIKSKLYEATVVSEDNTTISKPYSVQAQQDDAAELHKAGKQLKDGEIKLQVDLMCGILRENVHVCYNISKCFTYLNPFGSAEALNAAISIHSQKEMPSLSIPQISSILTCLRVMLDTSEALKDPDVINQQVALQCLKFYDFEKSDETLFLPPKQFYWIPELAKDAMAQKDSDGMIQLRVADVYKTVQKHVISLACGCLQLKMDEYLYEQISADKYAMLNVALTKPDKDFAVSCSSTRDLSPYLHHCAQLIEVGYYHSEFDSFQPSKDAKFNSASSMIHFGSTRLVNAFSPQWNFYLPLTRKDIKMVQFSKVVCHQMNQSIDSIIEKKKYDPARDINSFLYKWHFLKVTGFDIAELEKPLNEEAVTVNEKVKQSSKTSCYLPPPVFIKENVNISSAKYFHSFLIWSTTCKALTLNGRFMYFAEGVVKRLLLLIAKNRYIQAKISALNAVSMLEIISVGLLGVLQASAAHVGYAEILVIVPQLYEHAVQLFDDLNAGERNKNMWLLVAVVHTVTKTPAKKLEKLYLDALRLLQRVVCILVGLEVPSFNILTYAQGKSVYNNGFERCFVLCLCLLSNLAPLIPDRDIQAIHSSICSLAINMQHLQSTLQDRLHLLNAIKRVAMACDIKDVFSIVHDLQQKYSSYMVCQRYTYDIKPFAFNRMDPRYFPQHTLQPLQFLAQQFSSSPQKPTIAPIGSPIYHDNNTSTGGQQSKQTAHPVQTGFPAIKNPSLPMRSKAPGGQSASVGVGGLNIDLGTSIDPNSDNVSLVFSEESLSPHQSPYEPPVSSMESMTQQSVRHSAYASVRYGSKLDNVISEGLQQQRQFTDVQSSGVEYVTPQEHFEMLNSLIAAGMTPEQLKYQIAWAQQNYYQSEAPLPDMTSEGGVTSHYTQSFGQQDEGMFSLSSQQLQFMQPTGGETNSTVEEEFEQTEYYSAMPGVGELQQLTSPNTAIGTSTFGSFDSTLGEKWYCRVCGIYLWTGAEPDDGESSAQEAHYNHCCTSQHCETLEHYRRYQKMLEWSYYDVMEEAKKIISGRKKIPQVISLIAKIDSISEARSRLGREHSNTESTCSWSSGLKKVEQIANELLRLVDEYHAQLRSIPKQTSYVKQGPELFVSDDEDYLDVDVPDMRSKKDKRHKQL